VAKLEAAIHAHAAWKVRLRSAIETGRCDTDVATVRKRDVCPLGSWLHHGAGDVIKSSRRYEPIVELHTDFHRCASDVLALAIDGRADDARSAMRLGRDYSATSTALVEALTAWIEELEPAVWTT